MLHSVFRYHFHLLTGKFELTHLKTNLFVLATLEVKEESWLNELRMLIDHLQTRRIWIPESGNLIF
jgi:hypothetical protein